MTVLIGSPQGHQETWREDPGGRRSREAALDSLKEGPSREQMYPLGTGGLYLGPRDQTATLQMACTACIWPEKDQGTWGPERGNIAWWLVQRPLLPDRVGPNAASMTSQLHSH